MLVEGLHRSIAYLVEDQVCKGPYVHLAVTAARRHHRRQHCRQVLLGHPDCGCCCCGGLWSGCRRWGLGLGSCSRLWVEEGVRQELLGVMEHRRPQGGKQGSAFIIHYHAERSPN